MKRIGTQSRQKRSALAAVADDAIFFFPVW